ncbi:cold shock domain-containing protein [Nocardia spumae]|uniref:cold shock domain-containing protein n=1 Tax=Nocardia spumae TaxID=2887190 RepID=UPI001D14236F|nr:cold shock domain-containing protein [Nocardia spumae]
MAGMHGTVKWFNREVDFGFIAPDDGGPDLLVETADVVAEPPGRQLREGQAVDFDITIGSKGPQARKVYCR